MKKLILFILIIFASFINCNSQSIKNLDKYIALSNAYDKHKIDSLVSIYPVILFLDTYKSKIPHTNYQYGCQIKNQYLEITFQKKNCYAVYLNIDSTEKYSEYPGIFYWGNDGTSKHDFKYELLVFGTKEQLDDLRKQTLKERQELAKSVDCNTNIGETKLETLAGELFWSNY